MRVIAGQYRGYRLIAPKGRRTRPTADRVKEAVFSQLGDISDLVVLDLFAGSGALGIEALSRGAVDATFVDRSAQACAACARNLEKIGAASGNGSPATTIARRDAAQFVRLAANRGLEYDLVFIDPPYRIAATLRDALSRCLPQLLSDRARVVAESSTKSPLHLDLPVLQAKSYGDTLITIYGQRGKG